MTETRLLQHEYSHTRTVHAITSFYKLLDRLFMPRGIIEYPPPEGWPQITPISMAAFKKDKPVLELMKHIPYVIPEWGNSCTDYCIAESTFPIPYRSERARRCAENGDPTGVMDPVIGMKVPPHVLCLANGPTRDSYYVLIDTKRGVVIWGSTCKPFQGPPGNRGLDLIPKGMGLPEAESPDSWMVGSTYGIEEFFELWKQNYVSMKWMPHPCGPSQVWEVTDTANPSKDDQVLKQILVDAGWPGEDWRRKEAETLITENEPNWWYNQL